MLGVTEPKINIVENINNNPIQILYLCTFVVSILCHIYVSQDFNARRILLLFAADKVTKTHCLLFLKFLAFFFKNFSCSEYHKTFFLLINKQLPDCSLSPPHPSQHTVPCAHPSPTLPTRHPCLTFPIMQGFYFLSDKVLELRKHFLRFTFCNPGWFVRFMRSIAMGLSWMSGSVWLWIANHPQ